MRRIIRMENHNSEFEQNYTERMLELVRNLNAQGVNAEPVKRLTKEQYNFLEFRTSDEKVERQSSEDYFDLAIIALNSDDKEWFSILSSNCQELSQRENALRKSLGI